MTDSRSTNERDGTGRVEAFSDGIFAIAATLLVLELRLPHADVDGSLWPALAALWPAYLAFAVSFFMITVTWVSHHDLMRLLRGTSRRFLVANAFLLFFVAYAPFPTAVLAANLAGPNSHAAVVFYCATFVLGSVAVRLLLAAIVRDQLLRPDVDERAVAHAFRALRVALLVNVAATVVAMVLPWVALALTVSVRLYWLRMRYQPAPSTLRHPTPPSQ